MQLRFANLRIRARSPAGCAPVGLRSAAVPSAPTDFQPCQAGLINTVLERPYHSYFSRSRIRSTFGQNSRKSAGIPQKVWSARNSQYHIEYLAKFWEILIRIGAQFDEICWKITIFCRKVRKNVKKSSTKFCWDFQLRRERRRDNLVDTFGILFFFSQGALRGLWSRTNPENAVSLLENWSFLINTPCNPCVSPEILAKSAKIGPR